VRRNMKPKKVQHDDQRDHAGGAAGSRTPARVVGNGLQ
jgi:hypothetical protein